MNFKKILLTTDFSDAALSACTFLKNENLPADCHISLLHVNPMLDSYLLSVGEFSTPILIESQIKEAKAFAEKKLQELSQTYYPNRNVQTYVRNAQNNVAETIVSFAKENDIDLIVVSTQGHGALGSLFIGSITQKLLLLSTCPVLVIPYRTQT